MTNKKFWLVMLVISLALGMTAIGCGGSQTAGILPENLPASERWAWKWDEISTAKVSYSVDNSEVCTITVSGTPDEIWNAHVAYMYTYNEGKSYKYTFEAWTQSGDRDLRVVYFENNADEVWLNEIKTITATRTTYTIYGEVLPRPGEYPALRFQCADQIGTFYVKVLEIREYNPELEGGGGTPDGVGPDISVPIGPPPEYLGFRFIITQANSITIINYEGDGGHVTIPAGIEITIGDLMSFIPVTGIGDFVFRDCESLISIIIPASVTDIGKGAFWECTNLTRVTFEGTIISENFHSDAFEVEGNLGLREKFYETDSTNGTPGTYTRPGGSSGEWTRVE